MRTCELEQRRVALWGFGREGRAAWSALRRRFPQQPLTLFCPAVEHAQAEALADPLLAIEAEPDAAALARFDVVVKSPGISPYSPLAEQARTLGAVFTSGTALWFGERLAGPKICITGTKGKSTTSALLAHLLRASGRRVGLAGNIGLPLLELLDPVQLPDVWVLELSSYQTGDACDGDIGIVLNLFPEHLDWHGSEARYMADKLMLAEHCRQLVTNAGDPRLQQTFAERERTHWFDRADGWHLRDTALFRADERVFDTAAMTLPGRHNRINLCAALTAIEALGIDARPLAAHAASFRALPHRLQRLGMRDGIEFVDDSISTTPHASLAALDCFDGRRVAMLLGGYDRGLDWQVFAERCAVRPPAALVTMGQNGTRIAAMLQRVPGLDRRCRLIDAGTLDAALPAACEALGGDGLVLLSPGAPSFPVFRDYAERGRRFAALAGFDLGAADGIVGLGIA